MLQDDTHEKKPPWDQNLQLSVFVEMQKEKRYHLAAGTILHGIRKHVFHICLLIQSCSYEREDEATSKKNRL